MNIPNDYPVQPISADDPTALSPATCGTCGLTWDDGVVTSMTPTPSGRCPFEAFHDDDDGTFAEWLRHDSGARMIYDTLTDRGYDPGAVKTAMENYGGDLWNDFFGPMLDRVADMLAAAEPGGLPMADD